jgi:recombination DNA repair RAD52 pathway protein
VTGSGQAYNSREKHVALGKAKKHALTDAKKRALQKFGILDQIVKYIVIKKKKLKLKFFFFFF